MSNHCHRPELSLTHTVGWTACVAKPSRYCSGASHGGVTFVETCSCGATRRTESNGRHVERGAWEEAAPVTRNWLVRRFGSNAANQSMRQVMPVAFLAAGTATEAIDKVAHRTDAHCYANQHLEAILATRARQEEIDEIRNRDATDRAYGVGR